jgi:pimeloyl-ACP methyl ester carboxylesterase
MDETQIPAHTRFEFVEANGQRFRVASLGEGERLALCLHGFPECWYSWRFQMPLLARLGYRVWAPDLRGYGESSRPLRIEDYAIEQLMDDVAGLIDASGAKSTLLIAHDWGGIIAWWFAMRKLRPLERLVAMNIPHMAAAREAAGWRQRRRSWYALFFQLPGLPERMFGRDARRIGRMFLRTAAHPEAFRPEDIEVYRRNAARPGALTAMIHYYRALVRGGGMRRQLALGSPLIEVPTLLLWGTEDIALGVELTHGTERYVKDLTLRYLPGVGHWVQQEAPDDVNALLEAWLTGRPVPQLPGSERYAPQAGAAGAQRGGAERSRKG